MQDVTIGEGEVKGAWDFPVIYNYFRIKRGKKKVYLEYGGKLSKSKKLSVTSVTQDNNPCYRISCFLGAYT